MAAARQELRRGWGMVLTALPPICPRKSPLLQRHCPVTPGSMTCRDRPDRPSPARLLPCPHPRNVLATRTVSGNQVEAVEGSEPGCGLYSRSWGACPHSPENSHSCFREQARWQPSPVPMATQFIRLVGGAWPRGFPERKTSGQPGPRAELEGPENSDVGGATLVSVRGVTKATRPWAGGTGR